MSTEKLGFLASGRGSNFKAIIEHIEMGILRDVKPEILIVDNPDANALNIADDHGIPSEVIETTSNTLEKKIYETLEANGVSLVILAGFMRILGPFLIDKYKWKIMNIHPSLLPSFEGLNAQRQALESGVKVTGCTIHYASKDVDAGPIILQHPVPVKEGDTEETLADRILVFEHRLYSKAIQLHADGRLEVENGRVKIDYTGNWEEKWEERQEDFIKHQKKSWKDDKLFEGIWK